MNENILVRNTLYTLHKHILTALVVLTPIAFIMLMLYYGIYDHNRLPICLICSIPAFIPLAIYIIIYIAINNCRIVVTDKRVYGTTVFGKRVDLPIDSISAVGTSRLWGISVGTSSGRIHFKFIKNRDEIHSVLSTLLLERQKNKNNVIPNLQQRKSVSSADEIKKYKELLDSGVITQEEFDAKKKQLLDL